MPPGCIYVGRPTKYGNPFPSAETFRWWLLTPQPITDPPSDPARDRILADIGELRGKDLACWCPLTDEDGNPVDCHANVLLELANK